MTLLPSMRVRRRRPRLYLEAVLLHRLLEQLRPRGAHLLLARRVRAFGDLDQRHVLDAAAIVERAAFEAEVLPAEIVRGENLGNALDLELEHRDLDAALRERLPGRLDHHGLCDVDRGETAADDHHAILDLEARPRVVLLVQVVVPVDERVLVDEPLADVGIRPFDRERPVAPGAAGQHDRAESPLARELLEVDVAADLGARHVMHVRVVELAADGPVLLPAQRDVPARQPVLDLPVGARILLEDHDQDAAFGELARHLGGRGGTSDDGDTVPRLRRIFRCLGHGGR
jgi:hypothetical protein